MEKKREEEVAEVAMAATGVALLVSILKHLVPCVMRRLVPPSPFLFLLVHVVVVSIVCSSFYLPPPPPPPAKASVAKRVKDGKVVDVDVEMRVEVEVIETEGNTDDGDEEEEEEEEVNAKAEAFIAAFRQQLLFDDANASGDR